MKTTSTNKPATHTQTEMWTKEQLDQCDHRPRTDIPEANLRWPFAGRMKDRILVAVRDNTPDELARGWLRYEALRCLTPQEYADLVARNLRGNNFDAMVDKLLLRPTP